MKIIKWFSECKERFLDSFGRHTGAWLLFGMFLLAEYGNYTIGKDLNRVCDLLGDHIMSVRHPTTAQQEIDNICLEHDPDQLEPDQ